MADGAVQTHPLKLNPMIVAGLAPLVLGVWGKTMRDAVRSKERWKSRRTPTQDPSANTWRLDKDTTRYTAWPHYLGT